MLNITQYHWVGYLLGLYFMPGITFMIFLSLHVKGIPVALMVVGWIIAICSKLTIKRK